MSKLLTSLLSNISNSQYAVRDTFDFVQEILSIPSKNYVMASFDIASLFTSIPVKETCDIILAKLFPTDNSLFHGFDKVQFSKMLHNCVSNNHFLFNGQLYEQIEGCPMGGCISPTMANIFLAHNEERWLDDCPLDFKPVLYRRYVDDTFLLFRSASHVNKFHKYLNEKHSRIKFTVENENNGSLPFLDVLVENDGKHFHTSTYRKPTFTGLGMKANSAVSPRYKQNFVDGLADRARKINSNAATLGRELKKL